MLVGHVAVAFVGKRAKPGLSLGTLMFAALLSDLLWAFFSLSGIEYVTHNNAANVTPVDFALSHSLLMVAVWATLFAVAYFMLRRQFDGAWALFGVVLSHWILDAISHKQALAPGVRGSYGLGLWNSLIATIVVEGGFWLFAIILYIRSTRAGNRAGVYLFWPAVVGLTVIWITNIRKGTPPPEAVIGSLIFFLLLIAWAYWMNRTRTSQTE